MRRAPALLLLALLTATAAPAAGEPVKDRPLGDTTVFAPVPDPPGNPEGISVHRGVVFVGTHAPVSGDADEGPSEILRYDLATGKQTEPPITIKGQNTDETHGVLWMAWDARGRLYVLDRNPPRLLRFARPHADAPAQETYATFPDLAPCGTSNPPCSRTTSDAAPFPDFFAFDEVGNAYVSDLEQGTIFIVRPGGGKAEVWFTDERLDSVFGPNGIALDAAGTKLYFAMTGSQQPTRPGQGVIYTLPLAGRPQAEDLEEFFVYTEPAAGPDGIAFGRSGDLYVALAGMNQISILKPDGTERMRFPSAAENQEREVPYDLPASIAFDGDGSLLVTNQSFFADDPEHMVVFDVWVDDVALQLVEPRL
ncbi:MAG: SMP-30/gluconolactonase/LRE family protein [Actinomycetota bacterium]